MKFFFSRVGICAFGFEVCKSSKNVHPKKFEAENLSTVVKIKTLSKSFTFVSITLCMI
jgi:hypothetical protein